jgi:hypothetical protein
MRPRKRFGHDGPSLAEVSPVGPMKSRRREQDPLPLARASSSSLSWTLRSNCTCTAHRSRSSCRLADTTASRRRHGGGGIRTHEALARPTVFKTAPFDRSGTPPADIVTASLPRRRSTAEEAWSPSSAASTAPLRSARRAPARLARLRGLGHALPERVLLVRVRSVVRLEGRPAVRCRPAFGLAGLGGVLLLS